MLSLLIHDDSNEALCEICEIQTPDCSHANSSNEQVTLCPNHCNVTTKDQSQEELFSGIAFLQIEIAQASINEQLVIPRKNPKNPKEIKKLIE